MAVWSVFDEGDVVAGLYAEHGKQLQLVAGQSVRYATPQVTFGDVQSRGLMAAALRVRVHLEGNQMGCRFLNIDHSSYQLSKCTLLFSNSEGEVRSHVNIRHRLPA